MIPVGCERRDPPWVLSAFDANVVGLGGKCGGGCGCIIAGRVVLGGRLAVFMMPPMGGRIVPFP